MLKYFFKRLIFGGNSQALKITALQQQLNASTNAKHFSILWPLMVCLDQTQVNF